MNRVNRGLARLELHMGDSDGFSFLFSFSFIRDSRSIFACLGGYGLLHYPWKNRGLPRYYTMYIVGSLITLDVTKLVTRTRSRVFSWHIHYMANY